MKLNQYFKSYQGMIEASKYQKYLIFLLVIANVVLGLAVSTKDTKIVMLPPVADKEMWVTAQDASMTLRESWALHVATLVGNVTPRSAGNLDALLGSIIAPGAYEDVMRTIADLKKEVETEQIEIQFSPTGLYSIPSKHQVAVSGELRMRSLRGTEKRFVQTYLIGVDVRNYKPSIRSIVIQEGPYKPGQAAEEKK